MLGQRLMLLPPVTSIYGIAVFAGKIDRQREDHCC
jgi:hypothetical protein